MINYEIFYKRNGVRTPTQLMVPTLPGIDKFEFPRNSLHHYVILDSVLEGPPSDEYFYRDITKKIAVEHLFDLVGDKGPPKKINIALQPYARAFQMKNKRYRSIDNASEMVKDEMTLVVVNYGLLSRSVRYVRNMYTEYNKWWNIQKTLWTKAAKVAEVSDRQQFIFLQLPTTLPSVSKLDLHAAKFSQLTLTTFPGPNSWFVLEMWKWLSEEFRYNSVIGDMPQEKLDKINLVYQESGRFILINLGLLNRWRYTESGDPDNLQKVRIKPGDLQRRFLRMLLSLMGERSVASGADTEAASSDETEEGESGIEKTPTITDTTATTTVKEPLINISGNQLDTDEMTKTDRANEILARMDDDLAQLEVIDRTTDTIQPDVEDGDIPVTAKVSLSHNLKDFDTDFTPEDKIKEICDDLADNGLITAAEYRRFLNLSGSYKQLIAPDGKSTLEEYANIPDEVLKIEPVVFKDMNTVVDKTMLQSRLINFHEKYIKDVMQRDVASMLVNAQKGGFAITRYEVERMKSILGEYEMHSVRITPVEGMPSTLRFKLPVINEDGVYMSGGVKYRMRSQRADQPFCKPASNKVALSSYFGKTFVTRSDKKVYDRAQWLRDQIIAKSVDQTDDDIKDVSPANVFDNKFDAPKAYTSVAMGIRDFKSRGYTFMFDRNSNIFDEKITKKYNRGGSVVVAVNDAGEHLVMDKHNALYAVTTDGLQPKGSFEGFIGINGLHSPVDFAQVKIYGKNLPVAIVLGYMYGLDNLLNMLKCNPRRVPTGQRVNLQEHEFSVQFADEVLVFSRDDQMASMVFGGLKDYEKAIRNYSVHTFDKPDVYLNILESQGIGPRYLREIQMFNDLFVDPITKDILKKNGQPVTFSGLLVKATEALLTDSHPDALDMSQMRIRGYERLAGAVYAEICQAVRNHKVLSGRAHQAIEMSPHAVWRRIAEDPSITIASDINPIKNLKEKEAVTFSGTGGRTSRSMVRATREYHPGDLGIISEGTVDNADVGINTFMSGNPNLLDVRGRTAKYDMNNPNPTSLLSSAALISVGSDHDDMKRVNFVGIQHDHGVACPGYTQSMVRTGYEQVIGQKTSDMFCYAARDDGKVISINEKGIIVEYNSGEKKGVELGRRFGNDAGLTFAHDITTTLSVGDEFKRGDILAYNTGFFEPDVLNPKNVVWKIGTLVDTVLYESSQTLEDASSISRRLAAKLSTRITKIKTVRIEFDKVIRNIITPGTEVDYETILCIIEGSVTSNANLFDEESINSLRVLSSETPTAKVKGVVEKIEVLYNGDKEDMSASLRAIANASDRALQRTAVSTNNSVVTGAVDESLRIDNEPLAFETMAIRFYITTDVVSGVGDKGVFGNQMKTVFSEVMDYEMRSENGTVIDAVFGAKSIQDRIVLSPILIGTTNTLLEIIGKRACDIYHRRITK